VFTLQLGPAKLNIFSSKKVMPFEVMQYSELKWPSVMDGKIDMGRDYKGYLYSEKMDGWFVYWDGQNLYTKSGKRTFAMPSKLRKMMGKTPIVGELVLIDRQATDVARLQKESGPWSEARLYAFDLPRSKLPFYKRTIQLRNLIRTQCARRTQSGCFLQYLPQFKITSNKKFIDHFLSIVNCTGSYRRSARECFGEGVVITDPHSLYTDGRADKRTRVKLKKIQDAEATVVGHNQDPYSLRVSYHGVTFNLGLGLNDMERKNLSQIFPKGSLVKFSYRSLGKNGAPKEARLIGRRSRADTRD
jgi:DNA ligase-1